MLSPVTQAIYDELCTFKWRNVDFLQRLFLAQRTELFVRGHDERNDISFEERAWQFVEDFHRNAFVVGETRIEDEFPIGDYHSFLAERHLSEAEGDSLLTEAFRVCDHRKLYALSGIVTRTEKLCVSVLEISQKRKEMTCDKYKVLWWEKVLDRLFHIDVQRQEGP